MQNPLVIDVRDHHCPVPILRFKRYLKNTSSSFNCALLISERADAQSILDYAERKRYIWNLEKVDRYWVLQVHAKEE